MRDARFRNIRPALSLSGYSAANYDENYNILDHFKHLPFVIISTYLKKWKTRVPSLIILLLKYSKFSHLSPTSGVKFVSLRAVRKTEDWQKTQQQTDYQSYHHQAHESIMFSVLYILILPFFRIVGVNVLSSCVDCYASTWIKGSSEIIIVNCLPPQLPANKIWRLWKLLVHFISKSNIWNNTVHSRQFWSSEAWDPRRQTKQAPEL